MSLIEDGIGADKRRPADPFLYPSIEDASSVAGYLPQQDFAWDTSIIGAYDQQTSPLDLVLGNAPNGNTGETSTSSNTAEDASQSQMDEWAGVLGVKQKDGQQGGAPMLTTPNCEQSMLWSRES